MGSPFGAPQTYTHRGFGTSSSTLAAIEEDIEVEEAAELREPEFDEEGNVLSEGDFAESYESDYSPYDDMLEASDQEDVFQPLGLPISFFHHVCPIIYVLVSKV